MCGKGIDSGSRLRVRGEGNAGKGGGPTGDLYVFINVRSHPKLKRDQTTILSSVEISYVEAILGTTVKVPTVDGDVDLKVPAGCQPETTLLMAKRGVPSLNNPNVRGDQKVGVIAEGPSAFGMSGKYKFFDGPTNSLLFDPQTIFPGVLGCTCFLFKHCFVSVRTTCSF